VANLFVVAFCDEEEDTTVQPEARSFTSLPLLTQLYYMVHHQQSLEQQDELQERREAELEFLACAYDSTEVWVEEHQDDHHVIICRRLGCILLTLTMPPGYPATQLLDISCRIVQQEGKNPELIRAVYKALPDLIQVCREQLVFGQESVLAVLNRAEEWVQDFEPVIARQPQQAEVPNNQRLGQTMLLLGRRLIFSHHIISKVKRADIHNLTAHYHLTGYMKIGWPGIILVEGAEADCIAFYDEIRPWSWKFLVVRGEQQESCRDINASRKFTSFIETNGMEQVAQHCREVGLEALFRTAMKVYDQEQDDNVQENSLLVGALVLVDHMNDPKGYRKWLRKTAKDVDCLLLVKQSYPNQDFSKRPLIIAVVVCDSSVQPFLKRWKTSRVDVDSKGKPCLERQMTVLMEGEVLVDHMDKIDWDKSNADDQVNVSFDQLLSMVEAIGGKAWADCLTS
jgi:hypothetical protein